MEPTKNVKVSYSITMPLFLIFLVLKLTGIINWSWLWVTSPLWLPMLFVIAVLVFVVLIAYLAKN